MTPYKHAVSSAAKYGGYWEDYIKLHNFIDSSKFHLPTWQHRAVLHSGFGVDLCEQVFGPVLENSDGNFIEIRSLAIQHIKEDCGFVPSLKDWLGDLPPKRFALNMQKNPENHDTQTTT